MSYHKSDILITIADGHRWSKKTNNTIRVLKRAFEFGYRTRRFHENRLESPASTGTKPKPAKIAAFIYIRARRPC
jgi:hypothetical protein